MINKSTPGANYSVFSPETWTTHLPNALGLNEGVWDDWTDLVVPDDRTSTNWLDLGSEVFNDAMSPYRDISDYVIPTTRMMPNYGQSPQTIIVPDKPAGVQIPQSVESPTPEATIQPRHRTPPTAGGYQGGPAGPPNRDDMPSWVHDPAPAGGSKKVDVSINESKDPFRRMKELALKPYGSILKD